jgi:hypothetical protein
MLQRPVAVDWAVPKKDFEEKSGKTEESEVKMEADDDDEAEIKEEHDEEEVKFVEFIRQGDFEQEQSILDTNGGKKLF